MVAEPIGEGIDRDALLSMRDGGVDVAGPVRRDAVGEGLRGVRLDLLRVASAAAPPSRALEERASTLASDSAMRNGFSMYSSMP